MTTKLRLVTTHVHSVTTTTRSNVSSPFGPVRAGLTTSPRTNADLVLTELLNSLERKVVELTSKSFTVLDTLEQGTQAMRALPYDIILSEAGTDE